MPGLVEMGGGMATRGTVTTSDMAADHAEPQMDPPTTVAQALFASVGARFDLLDLSEMVAELFGFGHLHLSMRSAPANSRGLRGIVGLDPSPGT
jgi:hypothetical protein